jgi:hypothetical protein
VDAWLEIPTIRLLGEDPDAHWPTLKQLLISGRIAGLRGRATTVLVQTGPRHFHRERQVMGCAVADHLGSYGRMPIHRQRPAMSLRTWQQRLGYFKSSSLLSMRTPVGIASASFQNQRGVGTRLYAVCNDGTCWYLDDGTWKQMAGIPGTAGADFTPSSHVTELMTD